MRGSLYCFQHDPALEAERQAVLAGQTRRAGAPILPEGEGLPLETIADVHALLRRVTVYLATGGRIEPRRVTALCGAADRLLRTFPLAEMEAELAALREENERLRERCAEYERELAAARVESAGLEARLEPAGGA
jgi:hypothetical protein